METIDLSSMQSKDAVRRGRMVRRAVITVVVLFVLAGLLNVFGHKDRTSTAITDHWHLSVTHASVSRGGLASNWSLELRRLDGEDLPEELEVRSRADYFAIYDENGLDPEPESSWVDGDDLVWTYRPPPDSASLVIDFDARLQPNARWRHPGRTTIVVAEDPVVSVGYETWAVP